MTIPLSLGTTVWIYDEHHKVYPPGKERDGSPIFREHFIPTVIDGETSRSWLLNKGTYAEIKIPKGTTNPVHKLQRRIGSPQSVILTQKEVDDRVWLHENRYAIDRAVSHITDADILRQIATLIGYKEAT